MELRHVPLRSGYAAVYTPHEPIIIGRPELSQWESSEPESSEFDLGMLERVRRDPDKFRALVFEGRELGDGPGCYRLDESLSDDERERIAFQVVRHTMPTFRALAALGVRGVYHVSWEPTDVSAMQRAKDRYIMEISGSMTERKLDSFVLHRTVFFLFSDLERALDRFVPNAVTSIERDAQTLQRLLEDTSLAAAAS